MAGKPSRIIGRPLASRVREETRRAARCGRDSLDPERRMEAVFRISMEALKLQSAGLRAQGFPEGEIRAILSGKRR